VAMVCRRFAMCSLVCGWLNHAVSWLQRERWQVGMEVPKGGVGGPLDMAVLTVLRVLILCRVDDEAALDAGRWRHFGAAPCRVGF
jgi:hypothetical protein